MQDEQNALITDKRVQEYFECAFVDAAEVM